MVLSRKFNANQSRLLIVLVIATILSTFWAVRRIPGRITRSYNRTTGDQSDRIRESLETNDSMGEDFDKSDEKSLFGINNCHYRSYNDSKKGDKLFYDKTREQNRSFPHDLAAKYDNYQMNNSLLPDHSLLRTGNKTEVDFSPKYPFNCQNIHKIPITARNLGGGVSKTIDIGIVNGKTVVIKRLSLTKRNKDGWIWRQAVFLKEIMLDQYLKHNTLIKLLGYCFRHFEHESLPQSPRNTDISAVYEYAETFNITKMILTPQERVRHALELAEFIRYLGVSPMGPLSIMYDCKHDHFLMVNNTIKMIDFDYINDVEYPCSYHSGDSEGTCANNLTCQHLKIDQIDQRKCKEMGGCVRSVCKGQVTLNHIDCISQKFLKGLLHSSFFHIDLQRDIEDMFKDIDEHMMTPEKLLNSIQRLKRKLNI